MKLSVRTFRAEWDLHAWSGVIVSLFLFVSFFCGVFALFHQEIRLWQDPKLTNHAAASANPEINYDACLKLFEQHVEVPRGARVGFSPIEGSRSFDVWLSNGDDLEQGYTLDPVTGGVWGEQSRLADELYLMHFFYRVPGGRNLSGVLATGLLIALVSGLVIHLKDLKRQFWRFRPWLSLRYSSSDAHKVLGVFGLPFAVMIGWSGALLGLASLVESGLTNTVFHGDSLKLAALSGEIAPDRGAAGQPATSEPLDLLIENARAALSKSRRSISFVELERYGEAAASLRVSFDHDGFAPDESVTLDATTGAVLQTDLGDAYAGSGFERVLFDLHYASYGGLLVKALYALLAWGTCAVIVTGNVVWLERRNAIRESVVNRLLERLTVGVTAGLGLGTSAYVVANRLLFAGVAQRSNLEFAIFLGVWVSGLLACLVLPIRPRSLGAGLCWGSGTGFIIIVGLDSLFQRSNLFTALGRNEVGIFVVECLFSALALISFAVASSLSRARIEASATTAAPSKF